MDKLKNEVKHLREQHISDQKRIKELQDMLDQGLEEIAKASEMILTEIAIKYGTPVVEDGEVIGARLEIPAPTPHGCKVMVGPYEHYHGLEKRRMWRLGVVNKIRGLEN